MAFLDKIGLERLWAHIVSIVGSKADAVHNHAISDVTNLQTTLDAKVPITRTVNGQTLSDNIALTASDVGAAESSHTQTADTITAGTFAGEVIAQASSQTPGTSLLRNSRLVTTETNPGYNGEICWTYE
jgi:hypothetical protein